MFGIDELSAAAGNGYQMAGEYAIGQDDLAAAMGWGVSGGWDVNGEYDLAGDDRANQMAQLLTAASAGLAPAIARGTPQQLAQQRALVTRLQAQNRMLTARVAQLLRQAGPTLQQMAGAYPTMGPGGQISYAPMSPGAAASPVRGGFGATGAISPVRTQNPREVRGTPLGFDTGATLILAGAPFQAISQPQMPFRPERFVVPDAIAPFFLITDIKIGQQSQFPNQTPVPGQFFSQNAVGVELRWDTAQVSQNVTVLGINIDTNPHRFFAGMAGTGVFY